MSSEKPRVRVRQMTADDVPDVLAIQQRTFEGMPTWTHDQLVLHLQVFPEGQLVAADDRDRILGSASSLIIDWDDYGEAANWATITGHGTFATHNPLGKTLYGADMAVDPSARRQGVGSKLYEARKMLVRKRGLKRMLTGGRIPGYAQVQHEMTPRQYVAAVTCGKRKDPTLSFQLDNDFIVLDVVADYLHDPASRGFATLLEWLNPEYATTVSLRAGELDNHAHAAFDADARARRETHRVRIAAIQYELRTISRFEDFANKVAFFARSAHEYRCQFLLFPEYFTMPLLSYLQEAAPGRAVRRLAQLAPDFEALFRRLATENGLYIIAGTHPVIQEGRLFNAAHLFTPHGRVFRQKKVHLTPTERGPYQMDRGHGFYVYHTDYADIAILVCYDVEFPEAARAVAEAGAEILFVPSCTDDRQGYCRVRYCAQSRAIENQIYVALTGTIGNLAEVPHMSTNYGQAAILTPSDYHFARDGVAAEGTLNQEQMIVSDVDLALLHEQRIHGSVIPLNDLIKDAYDRVIHVSDRIETSTAKPELEDAREDSGRADSAAISAGHPI